MTEDPFGRLERRLERERAARLEAERLLGEKAEVLFAANERLQRRNARERAARLEAERLLGDKARELSDANERLQLLLDELEDKVTSRTESLRITLDEAERANRIKSDFLAMISHEIRTPMNAIHGMAQLLEESGLQDDQHGMAKLIIQSSEALLGIVNDLLDISKIEAGQLELEEVTFSLAGTVQDVIDLYEGRARKKGLDLELRIDDKARTHYRGDPGRLRQILMNLVDNAIKYSSSGVVRVAVGRIDTGTFGNRLRISVSDSGPGIPAEKRSRLFQKFDRIGLTGNRGIEGTGLGLALCKQMVELMNGAIGVDSEAGKGSVFWFEVPLMVVNEVPVRAEPPGPAAAMSENRRMRILVAEDNPANQIVIQMMLQKAGHMVELASNGLEAVDAVRLAPFDLVLMDMQMPDLDGLDATRRIRALGGAATRLPILALTANAMEGDRQRCFEAGMNGFLSKPISRTALHEALAEYAGDPAADPR